MSPGNEQTVDYVMKMVPVEALKAGNLGSLWRILKEKRGHAGLSVTCERKAVERTGQVDGRPWQAQRGAGNSGGTLAKGHRFRERNAPSCND